MRTRAAILAFGMATACTGGSPESVAPPTTTTTSETSVPPSGETTTTAGGLAVTTTTEVKPLKPSTTQETACRPFGNTTSKAKNVSPETGVRLTLLVGSNARLGEWPKPCIERFVIQFAGGGQPPGWNVEYRPYEQVTGPSGEPPDIRGNAFLTATVGAWMYDEPEHRGPNVVRNDGLDVIQEAVLIENFEGQATWAIGLEEQRPFQVSELTNPYRLIIDVYDPKHN